MNNILEAYLVIVENLMQTI